MVGQNKTESLVKYIFLSFIALITLMPIFITILGGLKSLPQLRLDLFGLPNPVMWENYLKVLDVKRSQFFVNFFNSSFIMIFTIAIELILVCLSAFALARIRFPGKEIVYNYFLLGLLFPLSVAILPLYIQIKNFQLLDNYFGVILPQAAFAMPWHIMLARGFFAQIPKEIQEASVIDGCSPLRFLIMIIVPLSMPIMTTMAVLTMVSSWNNYFLPLLILGNEKLFTLPMGVMGFRNQYLLDWSLILAFLTLAMVPVIIFYMLAQKYIIAGLTGGSVKE